MNTAGANELGYASAAILSALLDRLIVCGDVANPLSNLFGGSKPFTESCRILSRRARAIDHLLYDIDSGFWRWMTEGSGDVLGIGVGVITNARPPRQRLLRLGQP
jgi:hypothetical protein